MGEDKWYEKVSFCWHRDSFIYSDIMELLLRTNFDIPKPPGGVFDREYSHFFTYQIFYWACQLTREKSLFWTVFTSRLWIRPLLDWIISIHLIGDMNWPFQNRIENFKFYASWTDFISSILSRFKVISHRETLVSVIVILIEFFANDISSLW